MPPQMKFAAAPGGIENGNRLGQRPVVRQSKIYRQNESGNGMKGVLGQDHLAWDANKQQGVFEGEAVYDIASRQYIGGGRPEFGGPPLPQSGAGPAKRASFAPGTVGPSRENGGGPMRFPPQQSPSPGYLQQQPPPGFSQYQQVDEVEYPLPGSSASCDLCASVVDRFYHCSTCREETGLFDLCVRCCGAVYLQQGTPELLHRARQLRHPTHDFHSHAMVHVVPT